MGVISVKGGGIRVVLSFNDSSCLNSAVKTILTCKDVQSGFCRRFKGYMHADNIVINGKQWGKFSYRWLGADERAGATPDDLVQLFPRTNQFKKIPLSHILETIKKELLLSCSMMAVTYQ